MTGAPGSGKSTSAQLVARQLLWLYYDTDCFGELRNRLQNRARLTEGHWTGTWIVNNIILNPLKLYAL